MGPTHPAPGSFTSTLKPPKSTLLVVKNSSANAGDVKRGGSILCWEDPLEKGMATDSSIPAWRIPLTEKPRNLVQFSRSVMSNYL